MGTKKCNPCGNFYIILETTDALIVSFGYQTVHVLPVLDGRLQTRFTRRINSGGFQVDSFMQRLLQLKYPAHLNNITLSRAEVIQFYLNVVLDCHRMQSESLLLHLNPAFQVIFK